MRRHEVKWHPITITRTITIGKRPYFTPQFTVYKANAMTYNYIRPTMNYELWNAMIFGFTEKKVFKFVFMLSSSVRKTLFGCPALTFLFWLKRASFATKESLFFSKVGKVTFSARKSLPVVNPRYLCIWKRDERVANSVLVFPECLRSAFALGGEEKHKEMRQQRHGTNERSLTYLLIGFSQGGWNLYVSSREIGKSWRK